MMSTLLKLGLSGYDVKPRFGVFQCEYLLQNPHFLEEKNLVALDTHAEKMNPPSIILGGELHGKACWLIAYNILDLAQTKAQTVQIIIQLLSGHGTTKVLHSAVKLHTAKGLTNTSTYT